MFLCFWLEAFDICSRATSRLNSLRKPCSSLSKALWKINTPYITIEVFIYDTFKDSYHVRHSNSEILHKKPTIGLVVKSQWAESNSVTGQWRAIRPFHSSFPQKGPSTKWIRLVITTFKMTKKIFKIYKEKEKNSRLNHCY